MSVFGSRSWTSAHTWSVKRIANSSTHASLVNMEVRPTLLDCLSNTRTGRLHISARRTVDGLICDTSRASRKAGSLAAFGALIIHDYWKWRVHSMGAIPA